MSDESDLIGVPVSLIGGAGFVGHHLALDLVARGADVRVIDDLETNHLGDVVTKGSDNMLSDLRVLNARLSLLSAAGVRVRKADARDVGALDRSLIDMRDGVVIHLAAVSHAGSSNHDPLRAFEHGMVTLANALSCSAGRVRQFVFFSSSMVYGEFAAPAVSEDSPTEPIGIYGTLKRSCEDLVRAHQRVSGLPFTILRPSALYGPRCVSRRVTQIFVEHAAKGLPIVVEGDGSEAVDFTYVDDLVEGVARVLTRPEALNETFNMTRGRARTLTELADVVRDRFPGTAVEFVERSTLRPRRGTLRIDKARDLLGYEPRVDLEEGIPKYADSLLSIVPGASPVERSGMSRRYAKPAFHRLTTRL